MNRVDILSGRFSSQVQISCRLHGLVTRSLSLPNCRSQTLRSGGVSRGGHPCIRAAWRGPSAQTDAVRQPISPRRDRWESSVHLIKGVLSSWAHPGRFSAFWRTRWPARVCASTVKMFCECHLPEFMSELSCFDSDPLSASSARMTVSRG